MARNKTPLYVIVDAENVAVATANTLKEARDARGDRETELQVKLFADHKGDKSRIGF